MNPFQSRRNQYSSAVEAARRSGRAEAAKEKPEWLIPAEFHYPPSAKEAWVDSFSAALAARLISKNTTEETNHVTAI